MADINCRGRRELEDLDLKIGAAAVSYFSSEHSLYFSIVFVKCILQVYFLADKMTRDMTTCEMSRGQATANIFVIFLKLYFSTISLKLYFW